MRIAVIGSGISGLAAAHFLSAEHEVTLFEAADRLGGHTATVDVTIDDEQLAIDTGFIVFNDWTYPNFIELLDSLGIASQPTDMSFSMSDLQSGLEYAGSSLNTLFAQRRNLVSPRFLRMVRDILRFNRESEQHLASDPALEHITLGEYLRRYRYSREFINYYLIPMGAAIWSSGDAQMEAFPLAFFIRFFSNHGLLNIRNRPQWRTIAGGSREYIKPLSARFKNGIRLSTPVLQVTRKQWVNGFLQVSIDTVKGTEYFDEVVFACHSNQALALLSDPSPQEVTILSAIPYSRNEVVLHTDTSMLPRHPLTWSSWNVQVDGADREQPVLTYNMNILQNLKSRHTWCVTLNNTANIREECIHGVYHYEHPVFSLKGIAAQERWGEINGIRQTWFCGAWWRNGFHEDGVWSAKRVAEDMKLQQNRQLALAV